MAPNGSIEPNDNVIILVLLGQVTVKPKVTVNCYMKIHKVNSNIEDPVADYLNLNVKLKLDIRDILSLPICQSPVNCPKKVRMKLKRPSEWR